MDLLQVRKINPTKPEFCEGCDYYVFSFPQIYCNALKKKITLPGKVNAEEVPRDKECIKMTAPIDNRFVKALMHIVREHFRSDHENDKINKDYFWEVLGTLENITEDKTDIKKGDD